MSKTIDIINCVTNVSNKGDTQMNELDIINDVISLIGKEGCIGCYTSMKSRMPDIYAYRCKEFGRDIIEFVKSL